MPWLRAEGADLAPRAIDVRVLDGMLPIGKGQRVGIFGGSGVGTTQSLPPSGPGSATGSGVAQALAPQSSVAFPIRGVPAPLGWTIAAFVGCVLAAYPLLLLARWQFMAGRRR